MAAQIRPNRLEVSDRFPMLGFTIRTDGSPQRAEVAVATDPSLFRAEKKAERTGANFYSSRAGGPLVVPRGEAIYVLPPEVLAAFIGQERLYFGLATTPERNGATQAPQVTVMPGEGSPFISLRGLTGRSLQRVRVMPSRQQRAAGYGGNGKSALEWAGDAATPGQVPAAGTPAPAPATAGGNGTAPAAAPHYDDGFGPLAPAPPPSSSAVPAGPETPPAPSPAPSAAPARAAALSAQGLPGARPLADQSFSINWDEVVPVPQPTEYSCWATAAAMVLGWRDRISVTPDYIAQCAGRTTAQGVSASERRQLAEDLRLSYEEPQSYTVEGLRELLENRGPLWVGVATPGGGGHAIVVTGMYSDGAPDGSDTFIRVTDPWDRDPGTLGAPGPYLDTHDTGSRYILKWNDFVREYEDRATLSPAGTPNVQITHAGGTGGRTPNRQLTPAGYAMAAGRGARPMEYQSFSINWDDLELINQPNDVTCWAASAAMVLGWQDRVSMTPESVAAYAGRTTKTGLDANEHQQFAAEIGLRYESPASYTPDGLRDLLERYGPFWVSVQLPGSGHAIVVTGMYSDGAPDGSDTFVRIADPWDRDPGKPGAPGPHLATHNTGSRYILTWDAFVREYEGFASVSPSGTVNAQILHASGTGGRAPNRQTSTPPGYAMAAGLPASQVVQSARAFKAPAAPAPRPRPLPPHVQTRRAVAMDEATGAIVPPPFPGAVIERVDGASGNVRWQLDQLRGFKLPPGMAPEAVSCVAPAVRLSDWPYLEGRDGAASLPLTVDWEFAASGVGNIRIAAGEAHNAEGVTLDVRARILDQTLPPSPAGPAVAALRVQIEYRFTAPDGATPLAITELILHGDGQLERRSTWQSALAH